MLYVQQRWSTCKSKAILFSFLPCLIPPDVQKCLISIDKIKFVSFLYYIWNVFTLLCFKCLPGKRTSGNPLQLKASILKLFCNAESLNSLCCLNHSINKRSCILLVCLNPLHKTQLKLVFNVQTARCKKRKKFSLAPIIKVLLESRTSKTSANHEMR